MKIRGKIALVLAIIILFCVPVFAHSGKTDSKGGHHDRQNGGYHYHHGYPAHDHTNGICPYEYDDKTGQISEFTQSYVQYTYSADSGEKPKEVKWYTTAGEILRNIFFVVLFVFLALLYIPCFIDVVCKVWEVISSKFRRKK
jgi:hypothetical protein